VRKKYRPLVPIQPLTSPSQYRLPDLDFKVVTKSFEAVDEIARSAAAMADAAVETVPPGPIVELESLLTSGYSLPTTPSAREALRIWSLNGWAIAVLEIQRGAAKPRKAERHYYAALNLRRGQLIDDVPDDMNEFGDALEVALYSAYFLRRSPVVSVAVLRAYWHSRA
jgi:hypothetical protein